MASDHSFDIVSDVNMQEVNNAINQALKEIRNRFDFKNSVSNIELKEDGLHITSDDEFRLKVVRDILETKFAKRGVSIKALSYGAMEEASKGTVRQTAQIQKGIPKEKAKEIVAIIKKSGLKVQSQIQDDQVRVFGKKIDDLQAAMAIVREEDLGIDLQFINYR